MHGDEERHIFKPKSRGKMSNQFDNLRANLNAFHGTNGFVKNKTKKMAKKKKTMGRELGKINWTGKTKSGKGRVQLMTSGKTNIKRSITVYKTSEGKRRMLVITTTRKVIKGQK